MLRTILYLVSGVTFVAGIDAVINGHFYIGIAVAIAAFFGFLFLPERKPEIIEENPKIVAYVAKLRAQAKLRAMYPAVELPVEWEEAMKAKAPPLDPLFLDAVKRR